MNETQQSVEKTVVNANFLIKATNIIKKYGEKTVLKDFNIEIKPGERIGIIGANGSGKSTITEILASIRKPTSGTIEKKDGVVIGFQFQESKYPPGITVMDMLEYYLETFNIEMNIGQLNELLNTYQLSAAKNKNIMFLSGWQQQRLNILLSVIHKPDLVFLDEVSTGLDIEVREEIFEFLEENIVKKNVAMILVSHNMSEIERFCTRIIGLLPTCTSVEETMKLNEFNNTFQTEQDCLKYIASLKENKCIRCSWTSFNTSNLRKIRCLKCHQTSSILHDTIFYKSQTPLTSWFYLIFRWINTKHGIPSTDVAKELGLTLKTAWRMGHEIRKRIAQPEHQFIVEGIVQMNEMYLSHMGLKNKEDPWWIKLWLLAFMKKQPII